MLRNRVTPLADASAGAQAEHGEPDRTRILDALREADGVVAKAARRLGMSRQALYRRMEKFGVNK